MCVDEFETVCVCLCTSTALSGCQQLMCQADVLQDIVGPCEVFIQVPKQLYLQTVTYSYIYQWAPAKLNQGHRKSFPLSPPTPKHGLG